MNALNQLKKTSHNAMIAKAAQKRLKAALTALTALCNAVSGHSLSVWTAEGVRFEWTHGSMLVTATEAEEKAILALVSLVERLEGELEAA